MLKKGKTRVLGDHFHNNAILYEKEEHDHNIKINRREDGKEINATPDVTYFKPFASKVIDQSRATNQERPITTDLRHLSLTASNITAKLTNQFIQIGLRTFD